jgi:transcription elongation factor Elf1
MISAEARRKFNEENNVCYVTHVLPKNEWYTCPTCNGSHSILEAEDCHRSEGWIPCPHCDKDGLRRTRIERVVTPKKVPYYG